MILFLVFGWSAHHNKLACCARQHCILGMYGCWLPHLASAESRAQPDSQALQAGVCVDADQGAVVTHVKTAVRTIGEQYYEVAAHALQNSHSRPEVLISKFSSPIKHGGAGGVHSKLHSKVDGTH